ncbi:PREDICTED: uncharacterized protein LOC108364948 [Rhagoletis zephyria]|uniref:uncharacterized protein LOC108364948 n=1 Tax=Rhagoletis zephyria TaxID=28612 RepID=UPI00081190DF|nr:PREDICTED: uncharacterized protein LOC108364948 [Rhagoletis zephyria]
MLLEQLILKLPPSKQFEWSRHSATTSPYPTMEDFANWITDLARVVTLMPSMFSSSQRNVPQSSSAMRSYTLTPNRSSNANVPRRVLYSSGTEANQQTQMPEKQMSCVKCQQNHKLNVCKEFKALSVNNRWKLVKANRLCFGCLQRGHSLLECRSKKEWGLDDCNRNHNLLLHQAVNLKGETSASVQPAVMSPIQANSEHLLNCRVDNQSTCLFKILPVSLVGPRKCITVYAMVDEGSSITLLEEGIANELGVKGRVVPITLQWYNENQITERSRVVNLDIKTEHNTMPSQLKNVHTVKSLDLPIQTFNRSQFRHFDNLPIASYVAAKPSLLIGLDNSHLSIAKQTVSAGNNEPIATETSLGWVVYVSALSKVNPTAQIFHVRKSFTTNKLHQLVDEYFSVEIFGVKPTDTPLESTEDIRASEFLRVTTKNIGNRYEVGLLWRDDHIRLPQSYEMAKRRLIHIENKMLIDEAYAKCYKAEINKYVDKGYAKLLSTAEAREQGPTIWYLPHFGVVNPHKPHKLRIVFDAAAAVANISLNSVFLKGPERAQPLMVIMYKFRQRIIAVAGDIEEIFSQVKIRLADVHAQRFLWRDGNQSNDIETYAMTSMIFGAACSPCAAEYIKNFNAAQFNEVMPRGAKAVIENTYVDDLVISFDNVIEASEVVKEAIAINAASGFRVRNFVSNCKRLQHQLNNSVAASLDIINRARQPKTDKILGMYWTCWNFSLDSTRYL